MCLRRPVDHPWLHRDAIIAVISKPRPLPHRATVDDLASSLVDVFPSTAAELAPTVGTKAAENAGAVIVCRGQLRTAWTEREKARREPHADPASASHSNSLRSARKELKQVGAEAVRRCFENNVQTLEAYIHEDGLAGFYTHPNGVDVVGKRTFSSLYIEDAEGNLLRGIHYFGWGWSRWFHTLLST